MRMREHVRDMAHVRISPYTAVKKKLSSATEVILQIIILQIVITNW